MFEVLNYGYISEKFKNRPVTMGVGDRPLVSHTTVESFQSVNHDRSAHDEFHRIASEIIQKIKEKRFAEAHADSASDGALNRASARLSESLLKASLHEATATGVPPPCAATLKRPAHLN